LAVEKRTSINAMNLDFLLDYGTITPVFWIDENSSLDDELVKEVKTQARNRLTKIDFLGKK
jgi:hypothetical protein